jgi:hypothetical protein
MKWLKANGCKIIDHGLMTDAARNGNLEIIKPDINAINQFELELKKVNLQWNYLKISDSIINGEIFVIEFILCLYELSLKL